METEVQNALNAFRKDVGTIPKNGVNPHFHSKFAKYEDIRAHVDPIMEKHGISVFQTLGGEEGRPTLFTSLTVNGTAVGGGSVPLPGETAQQIGASVTYMRRYALVTILGLVTDDDDDGNSAQPRTQTSQGGHQRPAQQVVADAFPGATEQANPDAPSEKQWGYLAKLTKQTVEACKAQYGALSKREMSTTIDGLKPSPQPQYPAGHEEF